MYTGHLNQGETRDVVINIDPNITVATFALFDSSHSLNTSVIGASGQQLDLDPVQNGVIRIDDPSTMVYLGYGFKQPRPGRWVVTLQTSAATPPSGADYAIAAQFNGGAVLQTTQNITIPRLNEAVTVTGTLTEDGAAIPLTSANATVREPDGSTQSLEMTRNENQADLTVTPGLTGIYGIEVNVLANSADGNIIDRAAFLTFEVQPTSGAIVNNQIRIVLLVMALLFAIIMLARQWKRSRIRK